MHIKKWGLIVTSLAITTIAAAADRPRDTSAGADGKRLEDESNTLEEVIVTGSYIPTAANQTAVPVTVISNQDILETGLNSNLLEILRKRLPSFAGRSNAGNGNATNNNQYTAGGSQIALRNLTTLVLINGRRVATSGVSAAGGKSFVDINQIPAAAIDHMEVLTDGASAIYGSDAVGGVVNIILKSNFKGVEVGARDGESTNTGHYGERSGYIVAGAGKDGLNITFTGSASKTDPLFQSQRPFISTNLKSGTNFPGFVAGNYLNPSLNTPGSTNPVGLKATAPSFASLIANGTYLPAGSPAIPAFNAAPYETILLQQEQKSALVSASAELIGKKLVAFGDAMYSKTKSFAQTADFLSNLGTADVPAGSPYNPVTGLVSGVCRASRQLGQNAWAK